MSIGKNDASDSKKSFRMLRQKLFLLHKQKTSYNFRVMHFIDRIPHTDFSTFIFDKDGTLTPPNAPMTEDFSKTLRVFLKNHETVILTARNFAVCVKHILEPLGKDAYFTNLTLACSNGTEIFSYKPNIADWTEVSKLPESIRESEPSFLEATKILQSHFERDDIYFEFRSDGMGAFVCIPRSSSQEERVNFDANGEKRREAIAKIRHLFPDSYEIIP